MDIRFDELRAPAEAAAMRNELRSTGRTFCLSVLIGAFTGISLQLILTAARDPIDQSEWWAVPILIGAYGLIAAPFVALGLALFGLPVSRLLRHHAQEWWVGVVAVLWGAVAGKLSFYAIDRLIFFGNYDLIEVGVHDMGLIYGVPTALAWWLLHRRELTAA